MGCVNNLQLIDAAKTSWAQEKNKKQTDTPTANELAPYLKDGVMPKCPAGGDYKINSVSEKQLMVDCRELIEERKDVVDRVDQAERQEN